MTEADTFKACEAFLESSRALTEAAEPTNIDAHFERVRAEAEAELTIKGVRRKDADSVLDDIDRQLCERYDNDIRARAGGVMEQHRALLEGLEAQANAAATLKPPMPATQSDRWLATIAYNTERQELRALARNWTLDQFASYYETLTDADATALVSFIEGEAHTGWPTIEMRASDSEKDAAAIQRLQRLINDRRKARTPLHVREARANLGARLSPVWHLVATRLTQPSAAPARDHRWRGETRKTARVETIDGEMNQAKLNILKGQGA